MNSDTKSADVEISLGGPRGGPFSDDWLDAVRSVALAQNWWVIALRAILGIAFGAIALLMPGVTLISLVLLFSAYMIVDGVLAIVSGLRAIRSDRRWPLLVAEGLLRMCVGALAFVWPGLTVFAFVLIVAVWSIVSGALMVGAALRLNRTYGRGWMGLSGFLSVVFGILLIAAPPIGAIVLTWWLGIYAAAFGIALLVLAIRLRAHRDDRPVDAAPLPA